MYFSNLAAFTNFRLFPESIPWLVANNKLKRAKAELHKAERWNKVTIPLKVMDGLSNCVATGGPAADDPNLNNARKDNDAEGRKKRETILTVLKHRKLRIYAMIMCLLW
jgi:hypothetical protein